MQRQSCCLSPSLGTCTEPRESPWDLRGHLLGLGAAAGVAPLSPRARWGEEGSAGRVPEQQLGTALVAVLSCSLMTEPQCAAPFPQQRSGISQKQWLYAFPSFTCKISFPC